MEQPFGSVQAVDPNTLTNFTLAITYSARGMPGNPDSAIELNVQQNNLDNFHVRVVTDGTPVESWAANGSYYLFQEGGVVQLPPGIDGQLFAPAVFMHSTPLPSGGDSARKIGSEIVNGRAATHYRMGPQDAARMVATDDAFVDGMGAAAGALDIWIDDELDVVLKISGEVAWSNADGSLGAIRYDYLLSEIGVTQPVGPPV
jgi:hypothetical protein